MPEPAKRTSQRSGSSSAVTEKGSGVTKEPSVLEQPAVGEDETKKPAKRVSKRSSVAATAVEPAVSSLKSEEASAESEESKPGLAPNSIFSVSFL